MFRPPWSRKGKSAASAAAAIKQVRTVLILARGQSRVYGKHEPICMLRCLRQIARLRTATIFRHGGQTFLSAFWTLVMDLSELWHPVCRTYDNLVSLPHVLIVGGESTSRWPLLRWSPLPRLEAGPALPVIPLSTYPVMSRSGRSYPVWSHL